jgi:hypothetical protein
MNDSVAPVGANGRRVVRSVDGGRGAINRRPGIVERFPELP